MKKIMVVIFPAVLSACVADNTEISSSQSVRSSSQNSSVSSAASSEMAQSSSIAAELTGQELYNKLCSGCHQEDGRAPSPFEINALTLSKEAFYSETLLTMPKGGPEACDQTCAAKVTDYVRTQLYGVELANNQKSVGVKPTKLLRAEMLADVIADTFAPITLQTQSIVEALPAATHSDITGFDNNIDAYFSDTMLEDLYSAITPLAEQIVNSRTVASLCNDDKGEAGNSKSFNVPADGAWHTVRLDMTGDEDWTGNLNSLRIDGPPNAGGNFEIDHIRLLKNDGGYIEAVNWNNNAKAAGEQLKHSTASYQNGAVRLALNTDNKDPYIRVAAKHNINNTARVAVRIRNQTNPKKTNFQAFFAPAGSTATGISQYQCANKFIDRYAERAFRRPITLAEKNSLLAVFDAAGSKNEGLIRLSKALMLSPNTLYQIERKAEGSPRTLTGDELAERLAIFLWGSTPDEPLRKAANNLQDPVVLQAQVERMLDDPKAKNLLHAFVKEWLNVNNPQPKPALGLTSEATNALSDSLARFFDFLVREENGTLYDLFTDNRAFVTQAAADIYGLSIPAGARQYQGGAEVLLPSDQRAGIVTRAGFIAGLTGNELTSPTKVGHTLRERILCQHIPFPSNPDDANIDDAEGLVGREFVRVHNDNPACAGCHAYLDNIGLLFESFNPAGRFRTSYDDGAAIDPSGFYTSLSQNDIHQEGELADSLAFSQLLAESDVAAECLAKNMMQYALDRKVEDDPTSFDAVLAHFSQSNFQLKELIIAIVTSDAFKQQGVQ